MWKSVGVNIDKTCTFLDSMQNEKVIGNIFTFFFLENALHWNPSNLRLILILTKLHPNNNYIFLNRWLKMY